MPHAHLMDNDDWYVHHQNKLLIYPDGQELPNNHNLKIILLLLIMVKPYWQIFGKFPRPFYWKTHPIANWRILERHIGPVLLENSSIKNHEYQFSFLVS